MKCVNSLCMKQVNTAADVLYCPICQRDGTANEINPQRFPEIHDDMPIEEVLAGHPGIGVRFQPTPAQITQIADLPADASDPEPEGQTDPIPDAPDPASDGEKPATTVPIEEAAQPDQAATPDSSPEQ